MAERNTLARPYAKAAFESAHQSGTLALWSEMLAVLAAVVCEPKVQQVIKYPSIGHDQKVATLIALCREQINRKKLGNQGKNFVTLLGENKRLDLLPYIAQQFEALKAELESSIEVEVRSAFELTDKQLGQLTRALQLRLSRELMLQAVVDKSLMGGLVVRAGDWVLDGSVRAKLAKLSRAITA
jgi:F-type H+-transporting ATPase subunit delta